MKCMILASGFGTRLYPLTLDKAKPLLPYKGKLMIDHIVDKIPPEMDILININKKFEADFLQWRATKQRNIDICVENVRSDDEKLGAVGSLNYWISEKKIGEDLLLFGSDNYFEFDLADFLGAYDRKHLLIAIYDVGNPLKATQYGVIKTDGNRIVELEEKPASPKSSLIATACYIIPARIFPFIADYCREATRDNLGNFMAHMIKNDTVHAYPFKDTWIDIGNLEIYHATR